ncbi:TPA: 50S ribosomal protein P1 [Candidatus Geothermarchaeota archaeon]|nr:50S ribosomal protein P1 [Candidatus Geothermarchaeota archaeon]HIQ13078.1 50S ribosomal protein P1 [Thermoprotei archaeon]
MKYIYAALLLHDMGKKINEENLTKIFEALGEKPDEAKIKSLVASLEDINIDEVIEKAAAAPVAVAPSVETPVEETKEEKKAEEEKKEEEEEKEEEAFEGLSALFG